MSAERVPVSRTRARSILLPCKEPGCSRKFWTVTAHRGRCPKCRARRLAEREERRRLACDLKWLRSQPVKSHEREQPKEDTRLSIIEAEHIILRWQRAG